mgnify:CR=1 FL=1
MNLEDGVIGYDRNRFGMSYAKAEQAFADAVYAIVPDATVAGKQDMSCVYVSLDLDPNENLPERYSGIAPAFHPGICRKCRCNRYLAVGHPWSEKIQEIMARQHYTPQALATLCGVSRSGVVRWLEGSIPGRRDTFIRIGFAAEYDLSEMNKFLQRYGRYNQLYAKSLEDSVYIFVLNSETLHSPFLHFFQRK